MSEFRRRIMGVQKNIALDEYFFNLIGAHFGTDATYIIQDTQDYIGSLHQFHANRLKRLLNDDPLLVCSLPITPDNGRIIMPERKLLRQGGNCYVITDIYPSRYYTYGIDANIHNPSTTINNFSLFGSFLYTTGWVRDCLYVKVDKLQSGTSATARIIIKPESIKTPIINGGNVIFVYNNYFNLEITPTDIIFNNTVKKTYNISKEFTRDIPLAIFAGNKPDGTDLTGGELDFKDFYVLRNSTTISKIVPFNGITLGEGLVDIKRAVLFPKRGTGNFTVTTASYML